MPRAIVMPKRRRARRSSPLRIDRSESWMTTLLATRITVRIVAMSIFRCGIPGGGHTFALSRIVK